MNVKKPSSSGAAIHFFLFSPFWTFDKKLREEEVENIMKTMLAILMKKIGKTRDTVTWEFTFSLHPPKVAIYTHTMNGKFYHAEKKANVYGFDTYFAFYY